MNVEIEVLQGPDTIIDGCYYDLTNKLVIHKMNLKDLSYTSASKRTIYTPYEDIHIPSTHNDRFSAKKGITAIFQYTGYKPLTPLSSTVKLFLYTGLDPHSDWKLILLNEEITSTLSRRDLENIV